ncbi:hypothetical protein KX530_29040, partial [Escherichia coli]|nr:hypothetical protein [Escherichia coli]
MLSPTNIPLAIRDCMLVKQENSLFDIVNTIRQAKDDRNITGIVMDLKDFAGGDQPSMQYI